MHGIMDFLSGISPRLGNLQQEISSCLRLRKKLAEEIAAAQNVLSAADFASKLTKATYADAPYESEPEYDGGVEVRYNRELLAFLEDQMDTLKKRMENISQELEEMRAMSQAKQAVENQGLN